MAKTYCVYIMTNQHNRVLYTGVTSDLRGRVYRHREGLVEGFTKRYNLHKLVYYETTESAYSAISREKQIKAGSRAGKIKLIEAMNPERRDLFADL